MNITKTYGKTTNTYSKINKKAKTIANNYEITERVNCFPMTDAFNKEHKPNFTTNPKCRSINP